MARTATNSNAIDNDRIISALLTHGTIKGAAESIGISARTISDRMREKDFQAEYQEAKSDVTRTTVLNINKHLCEAIDTIADLMKDKDVSPAIRLQAAQTILKNSDGYVRTLASEEYKAASIKRSPFDF